MHGGVVEAVAQDGPQELRLRVGGLAQQLQALGRGLLQDAVDDGVGLGAARHVLALRRIEAQDVLAHLLVEAGARLLTQRALLDQAADDGRRGVAGVERVVLQVVLQRLDDVRHRVEADDVRGAERARARAAQLLAGEVVDHVVRQAELLGLDDGGQHAGDAHAVGHEVGRVLGAHDALAERRGDERFELVEDVRLGGGRRDQLHQAHVARRVEEVDAAEARLDLLRQHFGELGDRQARGVGRDDGVRGDERRDLGVQVELPVHALGDGLDDEVAVAQQLEVVLVVRLLDQRGVLGHAQRRRLQLLQAVDGLRDDPVLGAGLGGQVEQHDRHLDVDQMGGDLRAHHAGAEHGHLANLESTHFVSLQG